QRLLTPVCDCSVGRVCGRSRWLPGLEAHRRGRVMRVLQVVPRDPSKRRVLSDETGDDDTKGLGAHDARGASRLAGDELAGRGVDLFAMIKAEPHALEPENPAI